MNQGAIRPSAVLRAAAIFLGALCATACRDRAADAPEISAGERAAFTAPADSSLTPDQVDRYLRTMLAQFDLVTAEAPAMHRLIEAGEAGASEKPEAGRDRPMKRWSDFLTATYVRAARRADANPAEMEYVGDRMRWVSGYLSARRAQASGGQLATVLRQQAEAMRGQPGVTREQIDAMLQAAEQAERQTVQPAPPMLQQNLDVLRSGRGKVTDEMWIRIASVSGGVGLMALGDLADTTASGPAAKIAELRELYAHALENRAYSPGGGRTP
ncbi:hypothetical protein [Longimicrobium sp.]|jgi:hypothetical protein|uniref:hypothetical protein n=1 Tax=Longimicrobium sp. TaxID=2029185 RepID=UPI002EDB97D3